MRNSIIKTKKQIDIMRDGGKYLAEILNVLKDRVEPGISTMELEEGFLRFCKKNDLFPACKGYEPYGMEPFPTGLCISLNEQSVHCFPKKGQIVKEGDVITIDTVIGYKGLYVDAAVSSGAGIISDKRKKLLEVTEKAMYASIEKVRNGVNIGVISKTMFDIVKEKGYDVLREYSGHGIGKSMHEYPNIPCYGDQKDGPALLSGMTVCIEPLVTEGGHRILHVRNGWETVTKDKKDFVQFEHTVLVTDNGHEILTRI